MSDTPKGYYIVLISVHGLIRGRDLELGRDADTGGQILYVIDLARALARHPDVWRVDLLTRRIEDQRVADDYAVAEEPLDLHGDGQDPSAAGGAYIVRLPCGPRRYLRKESLWPYLDSFTDQAIQHIRRIGRVPDVVHGHYADGGYVGYRLAGLLGATQVQTGHSLGRVKQERLLAQGLKPQVIEQQYNIAARIEAEELALDHAELVVASTHQEVEEQYQQYQNYQPKRMAVIPPGIDLSRFGPPSLGERGITIEAEIDRFLRQPRKPLILALSRADPRKNIPALLHAYGRHPRLRELANLCIVAGNRDDLADLERGAREVITELLTLIDRYDLYGQVAIPKHHAADDVPRIYRLAARRRGLFVNPALTEPFGLTLLEAAASGLPLLATNDGGPRDIVTNCRNGELFDPLDTEQLAEKLELALSDRRQWSRWSKAGISGVRRHYSWDGHVRSYLQSLERLWRGKRRRRELKTTSRLSTFKRLLVCELDEVLLGDRPGLEQLMALLRDSQGLGLAITTGRRYRSAMRLIERHGIRRPDILISSVAAEVRSGQQLELDQQWARHIDYRWDPAALRKLVNRLPGLRPQADKDQHRYKLSWFLDQSRAPCISDIVRLLRRQDLHANVVLSYGMFLDLLPSRCSKGAALRHLGLRWDIPPQALLVAGSAGAEEGMLKGDTWAVVPANHGAELDHLRGRPHIHFAEAEHACAVLEGIEHYDFLNRPRDPGGDEAGAEAAGKATRETA